MDRAVKRSVHRISNFLVVLAILAGCSGHPSPQPAGAAPKAESPKPKARVSSRPGNTDGGVLIIEYHKVAKEDARWDRSIEKFKKDLGRLYSMGFRPVSLSSYLDNKMDLPPGSSPVIFTFDDSHPTQFRLLPDGSLDPDCSLGIWRAFAQKHADFPIRATFFILPSTGPWGQPELAENKFAMLKEWGCEIGSHTITHVNLKKVTEAKAEKELSDAAAYIRSKGFEPAAIALPYGISPKNPSILTKHNRAALLVGAGPAPSPTSKEFNPMRLPRVQGIEGDYGITFWLDKVEKGSFKPYVQP